MALADQVQARHAALAGVAATEAVVFAIRGAFTFQMVFAHVEILVASVVVLNISAA